MADYHAILKRAIGALPEPTGEARRAVYEKARAALVNQLKSFDPPLSASEITQQRLQLEDAIRRVEGEAAKGVLNQSLARAATSGEARTGRPTPPTSMPRPTSPTRPPGPDMRPGAVDERPTSRTMPPAAGTRPPAPTRPPAASAPPPRPGAAASTPTGNTLPPTGGTPMRPPRPPVGRAGEPPAREERETGRTEPPSRVVDTRPPAAERIPPRSAPVAEPIADTGLEPPTAAETSPTGGPHAERKRLSLKETSRTLSFPRAPAPVDDAPGPGMTEADLIGSDVGEPRPTVRPVDRPAPPAPAPEVAPPLPNLAEIAIPAEDPTPPTTGKSGKAARGKAGRREPVEAVPISGEKPRRLPLLVGLSAAGLVVAVGITALWTKRDEVAAYFGTEKQTNGGPVRAGTEKALPPKVADRLAPDDGQGARSGDGVKVVATQPITSNPQVQPAPGPNAPKPGTAVAAAPATTTTDIPPVPTQAVPAVAQKAVLLEEGLGGSTQNLISPGKVVWRVVRESPGQGKAPVTMIKGQVDVPDRGLQLALSIQPNADPSFPASHLIELKFQVPPDFDNKGVSNVPGLILKQTEQARGDPLEGVAARISAGFFWVALSAPEAAKTKNLGLLKDRGWIDIPILFDNGRRGILTLEKAGAGDRVVSDALTAWAQGG